MVPRTITRLSAGWLATLALSHAVCARAPEPEPRVLQVTESLAKEVDALFKPFDSRESPGYAVGIVQRGKLVYGRGFGSANLDYSQPITTRSVFNVASLSKQFTGAAVALLIRDGKVSLEDEVREHIPEFPERFRSVRIKHLVYMTSGIPEYYEQDRPGLRTWDRDHFTVDDAIAASLAAPKLDFAPGTKWAYSNVNYMLLAKIVERVSGSSFSSFMRRRVFEPLKMADTHVNDDVTRVVPNRVTGYNVRPDGGYSRHERLSPHYGGSGVFTTVEDLARWDESFRNHALGGPELTALLLGTMRFDHEKANDAFGLVWGEHRGLRTLWYEGGDAGFSAYMVRLPDDDLAVIILSNLGSGRAVAKARQVLDILVHP